MLRVGGGKAQSAVDIALMPGDFLSALAQSGFVLTVSEQRCISSLAGVFVQRIFIGRALVLDRRLTEVLTFEQNLGQQEIGVGAVRLTREVVQVLSIPARRFLVIRTLTVLLRLGVIVLREVSQIFFQMGRDGRIGFTRIAFSECAVHAVALDEALLALEYQRRESAALVGLDDFDLQQW